jgi:hypothetical protein
MEIPGQISAEIDRRAEPVKTLYELTPALRADHDLVEDDKHKFRSGLIAALARRKIFPADVTDISEDALLWKGADYLSTGHTGGRGSQQCS